MTELVARIDREFHCNYTSGGIPSTEHIPIILILMISAPLAAHLESENVEFMQFAFRWMNCLLMREISVQNTIRMWDTYLVSMRYIETLAWSGTDVSIVLIL